MIGKATDSVLQAGALGSLVNASTYGRTIPVIYGTVRSPILAIWAANIRSGGSSSKKGKKKGIVTYVENIDLLLGHNPIGGPLQCWDNANTFYPLEFAVYTHQIDFHSWGSVTVPDSQFYAVVAVTQTIPYSASFDDYGAPAPSSPSGNFDIPLWNAAYNGPDPMNSSAFQNYPYAYFWLPGSGPTITFPFYGFADGPVINVYYAKFSPNAYAYSKSNTGTKNGTDVPIAALRLTWEPQLGNGPEFSVAPSQQIIYPFFAGVGSPDIDLGTSGGIPNINIEVAGSFPVYADSSLATAGGDADFADMIVDIFNSGPIQAGVDGALGLTAVQHGLNCNDYPGVIQKAYFYNNNDLSTPNPIPLPVTQGSFLVAGYTNNSGSAPSGITDTLGNSWTNVLAANPSSGTYAYVWWCQVAATGVDAITITGANGTLQQLTVAEVGGFDTLEAVVTRCHFGSGLHHQQFHDRPHFSRIDLELVRRRWWISDFVCGNNGSAMAECHGKPWRTSRQFRTTQSMGSRNIHGFTFARCHHFTVTLSLGRRFLCVQKHRGPTVPDLSWKHPGANYPCECEVGSARRRLVGFHQYQHCTKSGRHSWRSLFFNERSSRVVRFSVEVDCQIRSECRWKRRNLCGTNGCRSSRQSRAG